MPEKEETINIDSGLNVSSIQITINLGQPVGGAKTQTRNIQVSTDEPPSGTLIRQILSDNSQKKVRVTFVPDDSTQNSSTKLSNQDIGDKSTWERLLGDPAGVDIDNGITMIRFGANGGVTTWLPNDPSTNIINHVFQETAHEPGGISVGDFIACCNEKGWNAAGVADCWSLL